MLTGFLCLTVTFTCFRCVFIEESTAVIVPETCVPFLSSMVTVSFTILPKNLLSFMVRDRSSPPRPSQPPLLGFESKPSHAMLTGSERIPIPMAVAVTVGLLFYLVDCLWQRLHGERHQIRTGCDIAKMGLRLRRCPGGA